MRAEYRKMISDLIDDTNIHFNRIDGLVAELQTISPWRVVKYSRVLAEAQKELNKAQIIVEHVKELEREMNETV